MYDHFGNHLRPVFVLGVTQRTGTHLLESLLRVHPEFCVVGPSPVSDYWTFEDHLLENADLLACYAAKTRRRWSAPWNSDRTIDDSLLEGIGAGLFRAFTSLGKPPTGSVALLRTPGVANLELLGKLFPEAQAIVAVRHPLAVATSAERSFGPAFRSRWPDAETWLYEWRSGVHRLLASYEQLGGRRLLSVRFEDLVENRELAVRMMLRFLDLDVDDYDFDAATDLPVRGSSDQRQEKVSLDWQPTPVDDSFDPVRRAADLPERRHRRLAALVAAELHALGYDPGIEVAPADRIRAAASTRGLQLEQGLLNHARPLWRSILRRDRE